MKDPTLFAAGLITLSAGTFAFRFAGPVLRQRIVVEGLQLYLADNRDAWALGADGAWTKVVPHGREKPRSAQAELLARMRAPDDKE